MRQGRTHVPARRPLDHMQRRAQRPRCAGAALAIQVRSVLARFQPHQRRYGTSLRCRRRWPRRSRPDGPALSRRRAGRARITRQTAPTCPQCRSTYVVPDGTAPAGGRTDGAVGRPIGPGSAAVVSSGALAHSLPSTPAAASLADLARRVDHLVLASASHPDRGPGTPSVPPASTAGGAAAGPTALSAMASEVWIAGIGRH